MSTRPIDCPSGTGHLCRTRDLAPQKLAEFDLDICVQSNRPRVRNLQELVAMDPRSLQVRRLRLPANDC
eukprot:12384129-Karenia_brevis.AAC.1